MAIIEQLKRLEEWVDHQEHIKYALKEEGNYVARYVKPVDLQHQMEVGLIYQKNQIKTWIKKINALKNNNGFELRKKPDIIEYMTKIRQKIGIIESDIDIQLKTIHGKERHQVYKDSPTRKKLWSDDSNSDCEDRAQFESRNHFAQDTFVTKLNRLEVDYKRASDKFTDKSIFFPKIKILGKSGQAPKRLAERDSVKATPSASAKKGKLNRPYSSQKNKVQGKTTVGVGMYKSNPNIWNVNQNKLDGKYGGWSVSSEGSKASYKKTAGGKPGDLEGMKKNMKALQKGHRAFRNEIDEIKSILNIVQKETRAIRSKIGY